MKSQKEKNTEFYESLAMTDKSYVANRSTAAVHRTVSVVIGAMALMVGLAHLFSGLQPHDHVFGLFAVNPMHTSVHFVTAVLAFYAAAQLDQARPIWRGLAVFFGLMTVLGLFTGDGDILGLVANNGHDIWLHATKTAVFAFLGWTEIKDR